MFAVACCWYRRTQCLIATGAVGARKAGSCTSFKACPSLRYAYARLCTGNRRQEALRERAAKIARETLLQRTCNNRAAPSGRLTRTTVVVLDRHVWSVRWPLPVRASEFRGRCSWLNHRAWEPEPFLQSR